MDMHNPKSQEEIDTARQRLAFEELFSMQLNLALLRKENQKNASIKLEIKKDGLVEKFIKNLPFELTNAQKKALDEIMNDLNSNEPMQRLLQGDVGSGKTILAVMSLLKACLEGVINTLGYDQRNRDNIKAAMTVRINSLLNGWKKELFDNNNFNLNNIEVFIDTAEKMLGAKEGTLEFIKMLIGGQNEIRIYWLRQYGRCIGKSCRKDLVR